MTITKSLSNTYRFLALALVGLLSSFGVSYISYSFQSLSGFNPIAALSSIIFWLAILALVFRYPLRYVWKLFTSYAKSLREFLILIVYLSVHLVVYGFILETIVTSISPAVVSLTLQPSLSITASPYYPMGFESILVGFFIYPNITITIVPFLEASLSIYSIAMAIIIGILVVTNIAKTIELKNACSLLRRSTAFVWLPVIGVVGGASCCLSLPLFITLFTSSTTVVASSSYQAAYYATYFLFPPATALVLKLNLNSIDKISKHFAKKTLVNRAQ